MLAALKGDPTLADIPVILVTIVDEKQRGYALGAAEYLVKPVDRGRLTAILQELCGGAGRVLVVEDDEDARTALRQALASEGWTVAEAEHGRAALDRLAEARADAIVLDLMMPEMDGFELVAELRRHPDWRGIPVLVVTALDLSDADRRRLDGSVARVIQKSEHSGTDLLREVGDAVAACVRRSHGARASRTARKILRQDDDDTCSSCRSAHATGFTVLVSLTAPRPTRASPSSPISSHGPSPRPRRLGATGAQASA